MKSRPAILVGLAVVGLVAGGLHLHRRLGPMQGSAADASAEQEWSKRAFSTARASYARVAAASIEALRGGSVDWRVLDEIATGLELPSGASSQRLAADMRAFLEARFGPGNTEQYVQWRTSHGYRLRDIEQLDRLFGVRQWVPTLGASGDDDAGAMFGAVFDGLTEDRARFLGLRGLATASDGVGLWVRKVEAHDTRSTIGGSPGAMTSEQFLGTGAGVMIPWFEPPKDSVAARDRGERWIASLWMVAAFGARQERWGLVFLFVWEPAPSAWRVHAAYLVNDDPRFRDRGPTLLAY